MNKIVFNRAFGNKCYEKELKFVEAVTESLLIYKMSPSYLV